MLTLLIAITSIFLVSITGATEVYPFGDVRNCLMSSVNGATDQKLMTVLPGGGFDNLRNMDMGLVHEVSYSQCQTTPDRKYLLPDSAFSISLQESDLDFYSEFFDHWDNYTDLTSSSINAQASDFSEINGKFSKDYRQTKLHQLEEKTKTTRTQIRHIFYTIRLNVGAKLHQNFKSAVENIGTHYQNNNTEHAAYLAQLLIRDYGTHYTTSVKAGAVLAKVDQISSSFFRDNSEQSSNVSAFAGFSFFGNISFESSYKLESNHYDAYTNNVKHTKLIVHGGSPVSAVNFTIHDWERGVPNALVAVDRTGKPLHYAINPLLFPYFPDVTLLKVSELVENATIQYYDVNTFRGCTDPNSPNFNFQANLADEVACSKKLANDSSLAKFGGIYQSCQLKGDNPRSNYCKTGRHAKEQKNALTKNLTCPVHYTAIKLFEGVDYVHETKPDCHKKCGWFHCKEVCRDRRFSYQLKYETYWCALSDKSNHPDGAFLFGGFYAPTINNPLTGDKACPQYFYSLSMLDNVKLCVSTDYELGQQYAVNFGGFFSCSAGNPIALESNNISSVPRNRWPKHCPHGTAQHLVSIEESCQINFCVENGAFKSKLLIPIRQPPFHNQPRFNPNITNTVSVVGLTGDLWFKNGSDWIVKRNNQDGEVFFQSLDQNQQSADSEVNIPGIVIGTILGTAFVTLIIVGIFYCSYKRYKRRSYS